MLSDHNLLVLAGTMYRKRRFRRQEAMSRSRRFRRFTRKLLKQGVELPELSASAFYGFLERVAIGAVAGRSVMWGLVGPPGDGKTLLIRAVAEHFGFVIVVFSAIDAENRFAGGPAAALRDILRRCHELRTKEGKLVLLFIDEMDLCFGSESAGTSYTSNRSQLVGMLIQACDGMLELDGVLMPPIPIAFAANDTEPLRTAVLREGRADVCEHAPTPSDRVRIAKHLLGDLLPPKALNTALRRVKRQPLSRIGALHHQLRDQVDHAITRDMTAAAFRRWFALDRVGLVNAVGRRWLTRRDVIGALAELRDRDAAKRRHL